MDVRIPRLLGMGITGSRGEETGQVVKFSLGTGSFAGTSHTGNGQVGCSLFEFPANGMFPEEVLRDILNGLWCSRRGLGELCLGGRMWGRENEKASTLWRRR